MVSDNAVIRRLSLRMVNSYLIKTDGCTALVDAGYPGQEKLLEKRIEGAGSDPAGIDLLVMTHEHYDHAGCLRHIKELSKALVIAHNRAKPFIEEGHSDFPKGTMIFSKLISGMGNRFISGSGGFEGIPVDVEVKEELDLNRWGIDGRLIHTPGHTGGSLVMVVGKDCMVGDTMFNVFPWTVYPPFANDQEELRRSWDKISQLDVERFHPGHGGEFGRDKFERSLKRI